MSEREAAVFSGARKLSPAERAAYLDAACAGNAVLRGQIEQLLKADESAGPFLAELAAEPGAAPELGETVRVAPDPSGGPGDVIDRYKLMEKVGEGGCGVVYVAEQTQPVRRRVALKVIKVGMDTKAVVARFEAERQALAMMDHPNIAKVLDAGTTAQGRPYFVMELVRGIRITDYCDQSQLSTRERLELFIKVCQAIQHAHQKGIIHRDIKPSNILVTLHDGVPVPKVIDFGIAKATEGRLTEHTVYTQLHQFIGTPAYMSPEQAEMSGLDIDTRSDIYSLGVLLYELLVGITPFDARELMELGLDKMRQTIREKEPVRPSTKLATMGAEALTTTAKRRSVDTSRLVNLLRGDLDWIVMKCLEKDRTRRYETANGLGADLQRHLQNEPVSARPPSTLYRFQKAFRRNQLAFGAAGAVVTALVAGIGISSWEAVVARRAQKGEERERLQTQAALKVAQLAEAKEAQQRQRAEAGEAAARQRELDARKNLYAADMNLAAVAIESNNLGYALELLNRHRPEPGQPDLRGWEWRYLWQRCRSDAFFTFLGHDHMVTCVAFSRDGKLLATAGMDNTVKVLDVASHEVVAKLEGFAGRVWRNSLAFAPNGRLLAVADGLHITLWDTTGWKQARPELECQAPSEGAVGSFPVSFSPDGSTLAANAGADGIRFWDTSSWQTKTVLGGKLRTSAGALAFSPDGRMLAVGTEQRIEIWDLRTDSPAVGSPILFPHTESLRFSADGNVLAGGNYEGEVILWDVPVARAVQRWKPNQTLAMGIDLSPDGATVATGGGDQLIHLWDTATLKKRKTLQGHGNEIWSVAFSPDGRTLASGSKDGTAKLWSTAVQPEPVALTNSYEPRWFSPDGRTLITVDAELALQVWDLAGRDLIRRIRIPASGVITPKWWRAYPISPDGKTLAIPMTNGTVEIWNLESRRRIGSIPANAGEGSGLAFSQDSRLLATMDYGSASNLVWDLVRDRENARFPSSFRALAFSPDGTILAGSSPDHTIKLWSMSAQRELATLRGHRLWITQAAFSPDGKLLVSGSTDNSSRIWDVAGQREVAVLQGHKAGVHSVAYSPDGKTIATGSTDETVKLWNVATGQQLITLREFGADLGSLLFSPDGTTLAAGRAIFDTPQPSVHLWRAPSFAEINAVEKSREQTP